MNSAGTHTDPATGPTSFPLRREIPACYKDHESHWVLKESGWIYYGWDVTPEDERALERGEIPPSASVSAAFPHSQRTTRPVCKPNCVSVTGSEPSEAHSSATVPDASCFAHSTHIQDTSMPVGGFDCTSMQADTFGANQMPVPFPSNPIVAYATFPDLPMDMNAWSQTHWQSSQPLSAPALFPTDPTLLTVPMTPYTGTNSLSLLATPELSPSGTSTCSSEDSEAESELYSSLSALLNTSAGMMLPLDFEKQAQGPFPDGQFFAEPLPAGHQLPTLFFPPASSQAIMPTAMMQTPVSAPAVSPVSTNAFMTPTTETARFLSTPTPERIAGPSRTSASRSKRDNKPYDRKAAAPKKQKSTPASNDWKKMGNLVCDVCGYVQVPGPGSQRSFKRHLETHARYKQAEWRCRGIPRPNGEYYGGCDKVFARKDALIRHIRANNDCISDFKPCEISDKSEF